MKFRRDSPGIPLWQKNIQDRCFHPTGNFVPFETGEIDQSIPSRSEKAARRYPDRTAVQSKEDALTYDELNKAANRIAHDILERLGEDQVPVAMLFEPGSQAITAMFAVLKAGKIVVPLDVSHPLNSLVHIIEDSTASLIVTNDRNITYAQEMANNVPLLNVDDLKSGLSDADPSLRINPEALALILYTSGSTGKPKGVAENHRNILHETMRMTNAFRICAEDRIALSQSLSFSGSVRKLFPALLNGASIHPLNPKEESTRDIAERLKNEGITIFGHPKLLRDFVHRNPEYRFPQLRLVTMGSQIIPRRDVEFWRKHTPLDAIIVINYSITETSKVAQYFVDRDSRLPEPVMPVGYLTDDTEVVLLDEKGHELGAGEVGEIAVRSQYLASGYWGNPTLTAEKFLPDSSGGNERIYLTGDLGRMMPDGCLVVIGRKDFQVKIRGYRVEVHQVETALLALDAFEDVAVVSKEDELGEQALVAYLVPDGKLTPTISSLRSALSDSLPDYMIPSAFVILDHLPLTPSGKVDRNALPALDKGTPDPESVFVPPRTEAESAVARIWGDALDLDEIGVHDNFFDLGGHSLSAMEMASRLEKLFGVTLSVGDLPYQTLGQLASKLEEGKSNSAQGQPENLTQKLSSAVRRILPTSN